jgi:hypothetical protein
VFKTSIYPYISNTRLVSKIIISQGKDCGLLAYRDVGMWVTWEGISGVATTSETAINLKRQANSPTLFLKHKPLYAKKEEVSTRFRHLPPPTLDYSIVSDLTKFPALICPCLNILEAGREVTQMLNLES